MKVSYTLGFYKISSFFFFWEKKKSSLANQIDAITNLSKKKKDVITPALIGP